MSVHWPLVARCIGVSDDAHAAFVAFARGMLATATGAQVERVEWAQTPFACCGIAHYWVAMGGPGRDAWELRDHEPPICPVCDPIGARSHDAEETDKLARAMVDPRRGALLSVLVALDRKQEAGQVVLDARTQIDALLERVAELEALVLRGDSSELADARAEIRARSTVGL